MDSLHRVEEEIHGQEEIHKLVFLPLSFSPFTPRVDTTSETSFWDSIQKIGSKRREEGVHIFVVLSAIGLHQNDKLFNGRAASTEGIAYAVEGFVAAWSSDQEKEGVQCNRLSILVGQSPILSGDRPLHFSKKKSFSPFLLITTRL